MLIEGIEAAGYTPGERRRDRARPGDERDLSRTARYVLEHEGRTLSAAEMAAYWAEMAGRYPIVSIEDGMDEEDWDGWKALTERLGDTRPARRRRPLRHQHRAPAARHRARRRPTRSSIKVNQIGTLTETLDAIAMAREAGYTAVMSHRSGETEDTTIADLAVATGCGQIKTGAPSRSRPRREVQPAAADRGGARRRRELPGPLGLQPLTRGCLTDRGASGTRG